MKRVVLCTLHGLTYICTNMAFQKQSVYNTYATSSQHQTASPIAKTLKTTKEQRARSFFLLWQGYNKEFLLKKALIQLVSWKRFLQFTLFWSTLLLLGEPFSEITRYQTMQNSPNHKIIRYGIFFSLIREAAKKEVISLMAGPLRPYPPLRPPLSLMAIGLFFLVRNGFWQFFFLPPVFGLK